MSHARESDAVFWAGMGLMVLLLIYLGLPAFWCWPFWRIYGDVPPPFLEPFLEPIAWLIKTFPAYEQFVTWQSKLTGVH